MRDASITPSSFFHERSISGFRRLLTKRCGSGVTTKFLSDVVWVVRKFRPDVMVTRFSPEDHLTHGHHTASAILAQEAFSAAADQIVFQSNWLW